MLRRLTNPTSGNLARLARERGVSLEQLRALVRMIGWDASALDAAIARLRGRTVLANDNGESKGIG